MNNAIEASSPASYVQRAMWAAAQRARGAPLNMMMMPWRVHGHLDRGLLRQALDDLARHHPTLRSTLRYEGGQVLHVTSQPAPVELAFSDLTVRSPPGDAEHAMELLREQARKGFDLARGPLFKPCLIRLDAHDHILCLFVHHSMCDAWSSEIIVRDLTECYRARCEGAAAELGVPRQQFDEFAREQIACFESGRYAGELAYWREQLAGLAPPLELPAQAPRKGNRDLTVRSLITTDEPRLLQALKDTARARRTSLFALLLAAVATVVHRRTHSPEVLIGVSTMNRWAPAARDFVGCATSLLPARVRLRADMTGAELAAQVHQTIRELLAYGRVPFELVLREIQGPMGSGFGMPVWAQLREPARAQVLATEGLIFIPLTIERAAIACDVEFDLVESSDGLQCELAHRAALFDPAWIGAMAVDFRRSLRQLATDIHAPVA